MQFWEVFRHSLKHHDHKMQINLNPKPDTAKAVSGFSEIDKNGV